MISINGLVFERRADGSVVVRKYVNAHGNVAFEQVIPAQEFAEAVDHLDAEHVEIRDAIERHQLTLHPHTTLDGVRAAVARAKLKAVPPPADTVENGQDGTPAATGTDTPPPEVPGGSSDGEVAAGDPDPIPEGEDAAVDAENGEEPEPAE